MTLAAAGLHELDDKLSRSLTISEKLARAREYDRFGSRGGQLAAHHCSSARPARLAHGFLVSTHHNEDGSLDIRRVDMGGPRCAATTREESTLVTIPDCTRPCFILNYDLRRGVLVVAWGGTHMQYVI